MIWPVTNNKTLKQTIGKADEVYTISIRVERKEAWIQDNGDTIDNWSVRRWNEKRNGLVEECFKQKQVGETGGWRNAENDIDR